MPPKRKRVDAEVEITSVSTTPARATRGSAGKEKLDAVKESTPKKTTVKTPATTKRAKAAVAISDEDEAFEAKPVLKKAKTSKAADKKSKAVKKSKAEAKTADDEYNDDDSDAGPSKVASAAPVAKKSKENSHVLANAKANNTSASQPYTPAHALSLFNTYVDPDTAGTSEPAIGPEGFEKLCGDAQIPLDGPLPLVLAWMLDAQEMAKIGKEEWVKGTTRLQISSLHALGTAIRDVEALLLLDKTPIKRPTAKSGEKDPYNRDLYWSYAADKKAAFLKLYLFCFALAKPEQARNIEMETATAFWSVLLVPRFPVMSDVIEFINDKGSYKGANKDLWNMMLEFCQTVSPSLDNYEADGAWPTLLDEFVAWQKAKNA